MANLVKKLGFWSIVLYGINSIIGTGIFLTPGGVIKVAGTYAPISYLIAAVFAIILATVFATAAKYVKKNGAGYAYVTEAFGEKAGIYVGITRALGAAIAWGIMATFVTKTVFDIFIKGMKDNPNKELYYFIGLLVLVGILLLINLFGNRIFEIINNISTIGKVGALILFIVAGLIIVMTTQNNFAEAAIPFNKAAGTGAYLPTSLMLFGYIEVIGKSPLAGVIMGTIFSLYAFTGFESIASAAEEMEEPDKTLPRAIPITIGIVATVYVLVVLVGMMLGSESIVNSKETVGLASAISQPMLKQLVVFGAVISMFGINVAASFGAPRAFTALADNGVLPQIITRKNKYGVPAIAFIITVVFALAFPLALHFDTTALIGLGVIIRFIQYTLVPLAVIKMASSKDAKWRHIVRSKLTEYVLPIIGFILSIILVLVYNYKGLIYAKTPDGVEYLNKLSINFLIIFFLIVPIFAYAYYYMIGKKNIK